MIDPTFPLIIKNRITTLYDGKVQWLSTENETGAFDILPGHSNFITMIQKIITIMPEGASDPLSFEIQQALVHVKENTVHIFVES